MIDKILKNADFHELMKLSLYKSIDILMREKIEFSVVANTSLISFDPPLKGELCSLLNQPFMLFALGGYTFSSLILYKDKISFHAGFGADDYESIVEVKLAGISQIKVEDSIIFVNFSKPKEEIKYKEKSKNIFLKNNKKLFK